MTFSTDWESIYADKDAKPRGYEPVFHKLVGDFIGRNTGILEIGCGAGENIQLFTNAKFNYCGIDGSPTAVAIAQADYPSFASRIVCGDFTSDLGPFSGYQAVLDRASIAHNDTESIKRCIGLIRDALPVGGLFISSDWFSATHSEFKRGDVWDYATHWNYPDGQFKGAGKVHFSSEDELHELFAGFELLRLTERQTHYVRPDARAYWVADMPDGETYVSAVWDMAWRKL